VSDDFVLNAGDREMTAAYVTVGNKSCAREIEALLLRKLSATGFSLLSDSDAQHRNFGGR
jgi:hypothetical protein